MHDEKKELLNKVDDSKRDFVKKLAIGSAYALPVMASFPLDSVRKKARAQGVYGDPAVVTIEGMADNDFNPGANGQVSAQESPSSYWVITFNRPMNKDFKDRLYEAFSRDRCVPEGIAAVDRGCEDQSDRNGKCNPQGWAWNKAGTKLYKGFGLCQGESLGLEIVLNPTGCGEKPFQDMAGNVLPRTEGCATYCEERERCS